MRKWTYLGVGPSDLPVIGQFVSMVDSRLCQARVLVDVFFFEKRLLSIVLPQFEAVGLPSGFEWAVVGL